ncbi:MAG TPA: CocE/NonD family hydrolase, partial [Puia sp.]|nr:CocE/NonD family hydrolase [Puia sp.]
MRKIFSLLLLCTLLTHYASAQKLYFPKEAVADSTILASAMPELAKKVIAFQSTFNRKMDLDHLFRLQMVANEYKLANESIGGMRIINKKNNVPFAELSAIQYQLFTDAKLKQADGQQSFDDAFKEVFREKHSKLDDKAALYISNSFFTNNGITGLQNDLNNSLGKQTGKDSIDIDNAIALSEKYNMLTVYRAIQPLAGSLVAEDNGKRYVIQDSVLIKTRDGIYISAIVVHKKGITTPQPTMLQFSIYTGAVSDITKDAVAHGYIGMIAFTRGKRFTPEQQIVPYEHDGSDCYDVIDWISKQSWSNGKVGMYGGSYTGFTQWATARHVHPALKTIVPSASAAPGLDVPMMNNVSESFVFPWIYYVSNNKFLDYADYNNTAQWD